MLGKPTITSPKPKDFRTYNQFFNELLDAHVITLAAELMFCKSVEDFHESLRTSDWRALIFSIVDIIIPLEHGFSAVRRLRCDQEGEPIAAHGRDITHENFVLFVQQGLVYRDFDTAVSAGDTGRIEHILSIWTTQLHGTQNINYPREMVHLMACLQKVWSPTLRDLWRRNCLVNPTGKIGAWVPDDLFGEYVDREIKAKIHPSSNRQSDVHLREIISCQVMSLYASKITMHREFRAKNYGQSSTLVRSSYDVAHMVCTLIKEGAGVNSGPRFENGGGHQYWQANDMLGTGTLKVATGVPLKDYKARARFNWHTYGLDDPLDDGEEDEGGAGLGPHTNFDDLL